MTDGITIAAAAEILGCSIDTLRRGLHGWVERRGFPKPIDIGTGRTQHLRFDAKALIAWRGGGGQAAPAPSAPIAIDWHRLARLRGDALDRGADPDLIPELNPAP